MQAAESQNLGHHYTSAVNQKDEGDVIEGDEFHEDGLHQLVAQPEGGMLAFAAVPSATFTAVEYPGFVRNARKAIEAMGGENAVPVTYEGQLVRLVLRPNEPYAHSLYADAKPCRCMLLKVSRRRTPAAVPDTDTCMAIVTDQPPVRVEVVGTVQTMLQFSGMADYQYLPADTTFTARDLSKCPAVNQPERAEPSSVLQPLLVVPPLFSKHDIPLDYAYKQFNFQDPKLKPLKAAVITYYSNTIPPPTPAMQALAAAATHTQQALLEGAVTERQQPKAGVPAGDSAEPVAAPTTHKQPSDDGVTSNGGDGGAPVTGNQSIQDMDKAGDVEMQAVNGECRKELNAAAVPSEPQAPAAAGGDAGAAAGVSGCESRVLKLLMERPVWSLAMMAQACQGAATAAAANDDAGNAQDDTQGNAITLTQLQAALAKHSYKFKSGPWKGLYIRRGYDPRCLPGSRQYQSVHYRLPDKWFESGNAELLATIHPPPTEDSRHAQHTQQHDGTPLLTQSPSQHTQQDDGAAGPGEKPLQSLQLVDMSCINRFETLPTSRSVVLQLCDIQDTAIQAICRAQVPEAAQQQQHGTHQHQLPAAIIPTSSQPGSTRCHDVHGWLDAAEWYTVNTTVTRRFGDHIYKLTGYKDPQHEDAADVDRGPTGAGVHDSNGGITNTTNKDFAAPAAAGGGGGPHTSGSPTAPPGSAATVTEDKHVPKGRSKRPTTRKGRQEAAAARAAAKAAAVREKEAAAAAAVAAAAAAAAAGQGQQAEAAAENMDTQEQPEEQVAAGAVDRGNQAAGHAHTNDKATTLGQSTGAADAHKGERERGPDADVVMQDAAGTSAVERGPGIAATTDAETGTSKQKEVQSAATTVRGSAASAPPHAEVKHEQHVPDAKAGVHTSLSQQAVPGSGDGYDGDYGTGGSLLHQLMLQMNLKSAAAAAPAPAPLASQAAHDDDDEYEILDDTHSPRHASSQAAAVAAAALATKASTLAAPANTAALSTAQGRTSLSEPFNLDALLLPSMGVNLSQELAALQGNALTQQSQQRHRSYQDAFSALGDTNSGVHGNNDDEDEFEDALEDDDVDEEDAAVEEYEDAFDDGDGDELQYL